MAQSEDEQQISQTKVQGLRDIEKRGAQLFTIPLAGETYSELTGAIGHSAVDMELIGNGPLNFVVRRDFEEIPAAYPHDLGTMSLRIPHLLFESKNTATAGSTAPISCSWINNISKLTKFKPWCPIKTEG